MPRTLLFAVLSLVAPVTSFGQATEAKLTFEIASVKPATPVTGIAATMFRMRGGPGTPDPGQITYTNISMQDLLVVSYGLQKRYRLSGPNWLENQRYDIVAKVPEGATREQVNVMVQNLLVERFSLESHRETRDVPGYELVVAKNGPKIKESPDNPPIVGAAPVGGGPPRVATRKDRDGLTELAPGATGLMMLPLGGGMSRYSARNQPLSQLASLLDNPLGRPVADKTGLTGKYDFNLTFTRDDRTMANVVRDPSQPAPTVAEAPANTAPDLFTAMQEQLGLKLEPKKIPIDVLVIDRLEKAPADN